MDKQRSATPAAVPSPRHPGRAGGDASTPESPLPLVLAITSDPVHQRDLVRRIEGAAVVVLLPDLAAAARILAGLLGDGAGTGHMTAPEPGGSSLPDGFEVDERGHSMRWRGTELALTAHEHRLLATLVSDPGRVWTHQQLHQVVWGTGYLPTATDLHSAVKRLRRKLAEAGVPLRIDSVRRVGFTIRPTQADSPDSPGPA